MPYIYFFYYHFKILSYLLFIFLYKYIKNNFKKTLHMDFEQLNVPESNPINSESYKWLEVGLDWIRVYHL